MSIVKLCTLCTLSSTLCCLPQGITSSLLWALQCLSSSCVDCAHYRALCLVFHSAIHFRQPCVDTSYIHSWAVDFETLRTLPSIPQCFQACTRLGCCERHPVSTTLPHTALLSLPSSFPPSARAPCALLITQCLCSLHPAHHQVIVLPELCSPPSAWRTRSADFWRSISFKFHVDSSCIEAFVCLLVAMTDQSSHWSFHVSISSRQLKQWIDFVQLQLLKVHDSLSESKS